MSDQKQQAKVLRIGIIHDEQLVKERQVNAGETVTIGPAETNTFVFEGANIDGNSFPIFVWRDGEYSLQLSSKMKGKVNLGGKAISVTKLRKEMDPVSEGIWSVTLTEADRGKIKIAPFTLLFRFVDPPPVKVSAPLESMSFKPRLIEDDDPVFLGILSIWMMLGAVFGVYVYNAERPEIEIDDLPDRFTRIVITRPAEPDVVEEPEDAIEKDSPDAKKVKKEEPKEKPDRPPPKTKKEQVQRKAEAKERVAQNSKLFQKLTARLIGTTGENAAGEVLLANAEGDFGGDIDAKLRAAADMGAEIDGSGMRTGGVAGGTGDRTIGELKKGQDLGEPKLAAAPKVVVKPTVSAGSLDFDGGDVKGLARVVRRYQGQLKYCYEKALKANSSLEGRVVLGWVVENERAVDVYVAANGTGDASFAKCLKSKVSRWSFAGVEDGDAKQPFVFKPEG